MGPKSVIFRAICFRIALSRRFLPGNGGPFSDIYVSEDGVWVLGRDGFPQVVSGNKRCNKPKQQATGVLLLALPRCPPPRASAITTYRWDRTVMVSATRALPLSSYLRLRHSPSSTTTCLVGDEGSRRLGQNLDR